MPSNPIVRKSQMLNWFDWLESILPIYHPFLNGHWVHTIDSLGFNIYDRVDETFWAGYGGRIWRQERRSKYDWYILYEMHKNSIKYTLK